MISQQLDVVQQLIVVITVLPTPVMQLYAGNPNQPSVCNNDPITDIDYIFNPQSNAITVFHGM